MYNSIDESIAELAKHGVSAACSLLLEALVKNDPTLLRNEDSRLKNWAGPSHEKFPKEHLLPLMVQGIHGLLAFIAKADEDDVKGWSSKNRSGLSQNGVFLDSMYKTPKNLISNDHTAMKEEMKSKTVYFADEGKKIDSLASLISLDAPLLEQKLEDKLSELVTALCGKAVSVGANCHEDVKNFLLGLRK